MNDKHKFRVWNKNDKKMINWKTMYDASIFLNVGCQGIFIDERPEHIFMQCVGLPDKSSTLIYEGDIVKNDIAKGVVKLGNPDFLKDSQCSMFYWEMTEWIDQTHFVFEDDVFTEFKNVEILGNVYENPELLEVTAND